MFKKITFLLIFSLVGVAAFAQTTITIPVGAQVEILTSPAQWCADEYIVNGALTAYDPSAICGATTSGSGTIDLNSGSLPVELSSFHAEVVKEGVKLHWSTAAEINNAGFNLYKDGELLTFVQGKGITNEAHQYQFLDKNVQKGNLYTYEIEDVEEDTGIATRHPAIAVIAGKGMVNDNDTPAKYALKDNYPNPFNPTTTISFDLPEAASLHLAIYDATGKLVKTFVAGETWDGGNYSVIWNGKDDNGNAVASGTYFCKMVTEKYSEVKQLVLLK